MGQQQLLLIVLSVIIVGIAVVVGINMFGASAVSANQDAVINDLMNFASRAQQYYVKPIGMGGGGNDFTGITCGDIDPRVGSASEISNDNGTYTISVPGDADGVTLQGEGKTKDSDGNVCYVTVAVTANGATTTIENRGEPSSGE